MRFIFLSLPMILQFIKKQVLYLAKHNFKNEILEKNILSMKLRKFVQKTIRILIGQLLKEEKGQITK